MLPTDAKPPASLINLTPLSTRRLPRSEASAKSAGATPFGVFTVNVTFVGVPPVGGALNVQGPMVSARRETAVLSRLGSAREQAPSPSTENHDMACATRPSERVRRRAKKERHHQSTLRE